MRTKGGCQAARMLGPDFLSSHLGAGWRMCLSPSERPLRPWACGSQEVGPRHGRLRPGGAALMRPGPLEQRGWTSTHCECPHAAWSPWPLQ